MLNFGDKRKRAPDHDGRRMFDEKATSEGVEWTFNPNDCPQLQDVYVHSRNSTNVDAFVTPQLILKHSWNKSSGRFHAWLSDARGEPGVMCSQSYMSVNADSSVLQAATVAHNSKIAVYYHFLTSGRFAAYRPKLARAELLGLPIPVSKEGVLDGVRTYGQLDERAFVLFEFNEAERILVEDAIEYTLGDYLDGPESRGRERTYQGDSVRDGASPRFLLCVSAARVNRLQRWPGLRFSHDFSLCV